MLCKVGAGCTGELSVSFTSVQVTSRTVALPFDSAGALCPVGDLFNYAAPSSSDQTVRLTDGAFDEETLAFCFYAREDYRTGQQVRLPHRHTIFCFFSQVFGSPDRRRGI
jgi:hypothetical protein